MDIALSIKSQMLATLMSALETAPGQTAGAVVNGRLLSIDAGGQALLMVKGQPVNISFSPQAMATSAVSLLPGSIVSLRIDDVSADGQARASLLPNNASLSAATTQGTSTAPGSAARARNAGAAPDPALSAIRAAVSQSMAKASASQQELGPLLANLQALMPGTGISSAQAPQLPSAVTDAAAQLLGLRYDAETGETSEMQAANLRRAIASSGVMHEARLASGSAPDMAIAAGDLKSALAVLKAVLGEMRASSAPSQFGNTDSENPQAPPQTSSTASTLRAPPHRDAMPQGQMPSEPDLAALGGTRHELATTLGQQADGALDRVRMLQAASMPSEMRLAGNDPSQPQRWLMELPMVVDGRSHVLPLRIEREPERRNQATQDGALWRVRFALDGEPLGALHAIITWRMRQLDVQVWAEREETRKVLRQTAHELHHSFDDALFDAVEIDIHAGRPVEPKPARGVLLDKLS